MNQEFLVAKKAYLRPLRDDDLTDEYLGWLNDSEVTRFLEVRHHPQTLSTLQSFFSRFKGSTTDVIFAIIDRDTNQHIGTVTINRINRIHGSADTGLMIGCKEFWGKGYAFEAWSLAIEYAFKHLALHKIIASAFVDNIASVSVLKKLGFKEEGILRQEAFVDGRYLDGIRMGMFREEFHKPV